MASPSRADALYRARLGGQRAGLLALIAALYSHMYRPAFPLTTLRQIGALTAVLTTRAQAGAVAEARAYLLTLAPGEPYAIPPGVIGATASGRTVADVAAVGPAVYWRRTGLGEHPAAAALRALALWSSLAASEPYRAANATVTHNAATDRRLTGVLVRVTRASACPYCAGLAEHPWPAASGAFAAHAHCQCTARPEVR